MTTSAELWPLIMAKCPKAPPDGVVVNELRLAAQQFCEDCRRWQAELSAIDVVADQQDYSLAHVAAVTGPPAVAASGIPANSEIIEIVWVELDDATMPVNNYSLYEGATLRWDELTIPAEASTDGLVVKVSLKPAMVDDVLPAWFLTRWHMALVWRTLANICATPNKAYSDFNAAAVFEAAYNDRLAEAKIEKYTQGRTQSIVVDRSAWI